MRRVRRLAVALVLGLPLAVACGEDRGEVEAPEPPLDASSATRPDAGAPPEAGPAPDTSPPGAPGQVVATAISHTAVEVGFVAPGGDGASGRAAGYEARWSATPITDEASFGAAKLVTSPPSPAEAGQLQRFVVEGLTPESEVHVALRARDAAGNVGPLSADASATTKARAAFLVTEIAPVNTAAEGFDFVELVAVKAGFAKDIEVRHASSSPGALLHKLAGLDVAVGDRIVVHVAGLPGPDGFVQEDAARDRAGSKEAFASADAFDVYSAVDGLVATTSVVQVVDGQTVQDAVPWSSRATDASSTAMTALATVHAAGAWTFTAPPVDAADDCATLLEVVNANASATTPPACGGYPGFLAPGSSIQRNGVVDTNTRADFAVALQTRGGPNAKHCDPEGAQLLVTEVSPAPVNLLELTVLRGGALRGFSVRRNPTSAAPNGSEVLAGGASSPMPPICGAAGDVLVVHLGAADGTPSESSAKDEAPAATNAGWYDGAWDVATTSASSSLSFGTSSVIAVRNPAGTYVEAAVFTSGTTAASAAFNASLQYVQALGLWMPADCNGQPCDNATTPTGRDLAASWNGVGATAAEASCRRAPGGGRAAAAWSVGPSSFGAAN